MDAFTLQYYEGFPLDQVAWGQIKTPEQWQALSAIKNGYQDTLFTTPEVARDVAAPLVDYIRSQLIDQEKSDSPKVTLMVGHDSNIASLLSALQVKPYDLPETYEKTPIGGQVVFERWHDAKNNKDLLKIEYVYQTADQLRDAEVLSLKKPPKRVTLQLAGCPTDANGYCSWDQFAQVLNSALQGTALQPAAEAQPAQPATAAKPEDAKAATAGDAAQKADADKAAADKAAAQKAADEKAKADSSAAPAGSSNTPGSNAQTKAETGEAKQPATAN